jgi:hypothetical protein
MQRRYPARHYVMIDDKRQLLAAMKRALGKTLTTVFVHQGHYATQSVAQAVGMQLDPPPDLEIKQINDVLDLDRSDFLAASPVGVTASHKERP